MPHIKNEEQYEALRDKGYNKETAARIANSDSSGQPTDRPNAYEDWTKEQLLERAKELDLEGRSDMDKQALIAALRGSRYGDQE
ncbi:MAG: hypothetical protein KDA29_07510 [Phycisphaerales bacterium]|nr:hypothetical protein [Phycisphaerales bacterium]